ncbi:MAG: hypothetical protein KGL71_09615 [Xanthomonadaceae bacterium]|nr:hypothetical protein [Xanthomonadaceae bacterium]
MKTQMATLTLAVLGGVGAMLAPGASAAANIGYYDASGYSAGVPAAITALGHTPVPISTLDTASLTGLKALVLTSCGGQPLLSAPNAALNTAVQNGMTLIVESGCSAQASSSFINSLNLPGAPNYSPTSAAAYPEADDIEIPAGSPITTGPGGTLTATSLDRIPAGSGGLYNMTHYYPSSALPAGAVILLTTGNTDHVGAFAWSVGSGRVIHTETQSSFALPGSYAAGNSESFIPGMVTYFKNLLSWASGPATTCASSGYTGTQLLWCVKICESGLTGKALDDWIHRWIRQFRQLPYCAVNGNPPPPPPGGEG